MEIEVSEEVKAMRRLKETKKVLGGMGKDYNTAFVHDYFSLKVEGGMDPMDYVDKELPALVEKKLSSEEAMVDSLLRKMDAEKKDSVRGVTREKLLETKKQIADQREESKKMIAQLKGEFVKIGSDEELMKKLTSKGFRKAMEDAMSKGYTNLFEVGEEDFDAQVKKSDLPVFVDFYATWCGPCKAMEPVIGLLSEEYEGVMRFAKLDVDKSSEISAGYEVTSIPNMKIFHGGKVVHEIVGYTTKEDMKDEIESALKKTRGE